MTGLPRLVRKQQEVVFLPPVGHVVVLGTAGSGKTSMAIYRAIELQQNHTNAGEKTLLIAFSKQLIKYMSALLEESKLPIGLKIENYHRTVRGFLDSRHLMRNRAIADAEPKERIIASALDEVRSNLGSAILSRPLGFFVSEIGWIQDFGVRNLEDYVRSERTGRKGTRVERGDRPVVWRVYTRYQYLRAQQGFMYDWNDLSITALDELTRCNSDWLYRHIIVDEGQDLSPAILRVLAAAIPQNGSLTIFGDVAQQIYGTRISWKDAGLNVRKVWEFKENYRNSKEIAALAIALTRTSHYTDEPDIVIPTEIAAEGPKPVLLSCKSQQSETLRLLETVSRQARIGTVAVLFRTRAEVLSFLDQLRAKFEGEISEIHPDRGRWFWGPGAMVGTYHAAKGLEFDAVVMPDCTAAKWPNPERVKEVEEEEACAEDARLLYVGITRAKTRLIISYSGALTILLPNDPALYNYQTA